MDQWMVGISQLLMPKFAFRKADKWPKSQEKKHIICLNKFLAATGYCNFVNFKRLIC